MWHADILIRLVKLTINYKKQEIILKNKQVCKLLVLIAILASQKAEAISLESRTVIEEIRARLRQEEPQIKVDEVKSSEYVPGKDLENALIRLRAGIYKSPVNDRLISRPVEIKDRENLSAIDVSEYQPGKLLAASLEKVRSHREIFRMIKLIKATGALHNVPVLPADEPQLSQTKGVAEPGKAVEPAEIAEPVEVSSNEDAAKTEEAAKPAEAARSEEAARFEEDSKDSATLLRSADLKIHRKLTHLEEVKSDENNTVADLEKKRRSEDEEDTQLNEEISKFEYKMPKNYRIIVR